MQEIRGNYTICCFRNATVESLRFLSAEQKVYDIGELVDAIRDELNAANANVILWGTGYGASLATWARREFPDKIQGMQILKGKRNLMNKNIIMIICRCLVIKWNISTKSSNKRYAVN